MTDLDAARQRWRTEYATYDALARLVAAEMRMRVQKLGLWCETSSRAKETHSLILKLLKKEGRTYESVTDKAGARCIVRHRSALEQVVKVAEDAFQCHSMDRKAERLGDSQVGYLSVHADVSLRETHPEAAGYTGLVVELQIRTLAQHLWSEMSHDAVYKPVGGEPPTGELMRRVNLMAGLIEVADMEFDRLNDELEQPIELQVYRALEAFYYRLTSHRTDPELSLEIIRSLLPLYAGRPVETIKEKVDGYVSSHEPQLQEIFAQQSAHQTSDLVFQPEALLIAEWLESDQSKTALIARWTTRYPQAELERLAVVFGHSLD